MTGRPKTRAVATAKLPTPNRAARKAKAKRSKAYGELVRVALEQQAPRPSGRTAADSLAECLDRAAGAMRYAALKTDEVPEDEFWVTKIDAQGNVLTEPNKWYQLEAECRAEVEHLAGLMTTLGIADRQTKVAEAQAVLLYRAIEMAARSAGIKPGQVRALGGALREQLVEGVAA